MSKINYRIYPTMLDAFNRYKGSGDFKENEEALSELLATINREKREMPPAVYEGIKLQEAVDWFIGQYPEIKLPEQHRFMLYEKDISIGLLKELATPLVGSVTEWEAEAILPTAYGDVMLYGKMDYILGDTVYDLKYCGQYEIGKYYHHSQKLFYPYCLNKQGCKIDYMEFRACDLKSIFPEVYKFDMERDTAILKADVEGFIEFLELHRERITDKKVFNLLEYA